MFCVFKLSFQLKRNSNKKFTIYQTLINKYFQLFLDLLNYLYFNPLHPGVLNLGHKIQSIIKYCLKLSNNDFPNFGQFSNNFKRSYSDKILKVKLMVFINDMILMLDVENAHESIDIFKIKNG